MDWTPPPPLACSLTPIHAPTPLFRTNTTDFCTLNSPARRDLAGEMTDACRVKGLGLFLSYSYALDWNHPYFYSRDSVQLDWPFARPAYDEPPPEYRLEREEDFFQYLQFIDEQLAEILYRYEPLAGSDPANPAGLSIRVGRVSCRRAQSGAGLQTWTSLRFSWILHGSLTSSTRPPRTFSNR